MSENFQYDVAIIGGGPSGSTAATFLKIYSPETRVAVFEREAFPRDHVGESLLPPVSKILCEIGAWDKVEAANFPIKIGATYRWGKNPELWDFEFYPAEKFIDEPRPAPYQGQRTATAFQVDRSIYDKILLDHARENGADVFQGVRISEIQRDGDRVTGLKTEDGGLVTARHYVDASGNSGFLRRAMGVECDYPASLKNIAIWDYWQNADWAVNIGVGATRVQVLSLPYGWTWFIPLGPTRTSIGLITPSNYYKSCGKKPDELYHDALKEEQIVAGLLRNATCENKLYTTRDWSYLADRLYGDNWYLIGEAAGFADPILATGMTMAHYAAREVAFMILELDRGELDSSWLKEQFAGRQSRRVRTHMHFAQFWYSANAQFKDLRDHTAKLAQDAGLDLTPEKAWAWLSQGGFIDEELSIGTAGFSLNFLKKAGNFIGNLAADSPLNSNNVFHLDLEGATEKPLAWFDSGRVFKVNGLFRGDRVLPMGGVVRYVINILSKVSKASEILEILRREIQLKRSDAPYLVMIERVPSALEAMMRDGWIRGSFDPGEPLIPTLGNASEQVRLHAPT